MTNDLRSATQIPAQNGFAPLRQPAFAVLWAATILGNTGSFIRDVASSWLVTDFARALTMMCRSGGNRGVFDVESWAEHLRQHKYVSKADADRQEEALQSHIGPDRPVVRHFLSMDIHRISNPEAGLK